MMWNGDFSWGWWGPALLLMLICMVVMMRVMGGMMSHGTHGSHIGEWHQHRSDRAERILADRLARGEINVEEYERRLAELQRARQSEQT